MGRHTDTKRQLKILKVYQQEVRKKYCCAQSRTSKRFGVSRQAIYEVLLRLQERGIDSFVPKPKLEPKKFICHVCNKEFLEKKYRTSGRRPKTCIYCKDLNKCNACGKILKIKDRRRMSYCYPCWSRYVCRIVKEIRLKGGKRCKRLRKNQARYVKKWRENNKEKINAYNRKWRKRQRRF